MENVVIIGSGCAGYTAAIYAARANLEPIVYAGAQPGGQLTTTTEVENFPGFPEGIDGTTLTMQMMEQAKRFGTRVDYNAVSSIKKTSAGHFELSVGKETVESKALIIATGASARLLNIEREDELFGKAGLTSCATCDGAFYRDVPVCVVGGGDSAAEEATFLTKFASKVYLIHRRDELRASQIMADRVLAQEKVEPVWNSEIVEYLTDEEGKMRAVKLRNTVDGSESELEIKCVFLAIGHVPNTGFLDGLADTDDDGYLIQQEGSTATSVEGIFAAGDVADHVYRQAITAAGDGCRAALDAERYLAELEG